MDFAMIKLKETCGIGSHRHVAFAACGEKKLLEHRSDGTNASDTLYIGCETVCANESRAELVPPMPSAAKLGALMHKFPYRDAFSVNISGVL